MKKVLCTMNSEHVIELGEKGRPFMVGLSARQSSDQKISALAGKIVCYECGKKIDADIFLTKKCDAPGCEEWTVVKFCDEHHRQHQEALELKRLQNKVATARLEFVAAIKLQVPKGVLAKIYADAEEAEEEKRFVDALRFYRQALTVWKGWQSPRSAPAPEKKLGHDARRGKGRVYSQATPAAVAAQEPVAEDPVVEEKLQYEILGSSAELGKRLELLQVAVKGDKQLEAMVEAGINLYLDGNVNGSEEARRTVETIINQGAYAIATDDHNNVVAVAA